VLDLKLSGRTKTGGFTAKEKRKISRLWNQTKTVHRLPPDSIKGIKVSKGTDTGNRLRIGNVVLVAREGASRITYSKKTGVITKTIKQRGSTKRIREGINPRPTNLMARAKGLKRGQHLLLRDSKGLGVRPASEAGEIINADMLTWYLEGKLQEIEDYYTARGVSRKNARAKANEILGRLVTVEVEYDEEDYW